MKKIKNIILSLALVLCSCITPVEADEMGYTSGDVILRWGTYPASEITEEMLNDNIISADYNEENIAFFDGKKIYRLNIENDENPEYKYFLCEDIEWNLVAEDEDSYLVRAVSPLDCRTIGNEKSHSNYVNSDLRKWLNEDFFDSLFSAYEKTGILTKTIESRVIYYNTFVYETEDGVVEDTEADFFTVTSDDKIFVKSLCENENTRNNWYLKPITDYCEMKNQLMENKTEVEACRDFFVFDNITYADYNGNGRFNSTSDISIENTFYIRPEIYISKNLKVLGDIDENKMVDMSDVLKLLKCAVGIENTTEQIEIMGDCNADGNIDLSDVNLVLKYALGISNQTNGFIKY